MISESVGDAEMTNGLNEDACIRKAHVHMICEQIHHPNYAKYQPLQRKKLVHDFVPIST